MLKIPDKLISKRLILRPYVSDDFGPFTELITDERVTKTLNFTEEQKTVKGARQILASVIESYKIGNPIFALAIIHKLGKQYLGSCGLSKLEDSNNYECFYTLLYKYWGNGFAIEAMKSLFEYAFNKLGLEKVIAYIGPDNTRSWKVAERSGMLYLGLIPYKDTGERAMYFEISKRNYYLQSVY